MSLPARVLVANRGAISVRIQRTLACMGIASAAVYSEAEKDALHALTAQRAACIGPGSARESYLSADALITAARAMQCDAVHPGYGFLSENADFADACRAAGLVFIGPSAQAMRAMGDKARARGIAAAAGVACVPGFDASSDEAALLAAAQRLGAPLLLKAAHGGGGRGMRVVRDLSAFPAALEAARRESLAAFGKGELLLERLVQQARHVEIQVLADSFGRVHAFAERECSLQRRHQKVIEESPSVAVSPALRERLQDAARRIASAVNYQGAGTLEFLLEPGGDFWFLEMNTRLQVEHGVTELVSGVDLVEWQVRIAAGERLPEHLPTQPRGHALQARLYAEDPMRGFLPQTGVAGRVVWPLGPGVRADAGLRSGGAVTHHYDPMLAKILAHGEDREQARQRLIHALAATEVDGLVTNLDWLISLLRHDCVRSGQTYTTTLDQLEPFSAAASPEDVWMCAAAIALTAAGSQPVALQAEAVPSGRLGAFRLGAVGDE